MIVFGIVGVVLIVFSQLMAIGVRSIPFWEKEQIDRNGEMFKYSWWVFEYNPYCWEFTSLYICKKVYIHFNNYFDSICFFDVNYEDDFIVTCFNISIGFKKRKQ